MKKYIAEALGTFALSLVVGLSLSGVFPVPTPVLAALTLGLFVYSIGHISVTHINPAVTVGLWSIGKMKSQEAVYYVLSQMLGGVATLMVLSSLNLSPELIVGQGGMIGLGEAIGTFFFAFGIASVVFGKTPSQLSGVVVGGSLLLGVALSALMGANGVLNPAVALGIGSFGYMYIIGPMIGAVLGMQTYTYLKK